MPLSSTTRRNFLFGEAGLDESPNFRTASKRGEAKFLFPFGDQTLPDVPPPAEKLTFNGSLAPYSGPWGRAQAAHLLRRTGFGLRKIELDFFANATVDACVNKVLELPAAPPPPPVNNYNNPDFTDPDVPAGQTWTQAAYNGMAEGYRIESWRGWWYDLMISQNASILERMTLFWHNHFATQTEIVYWGRSVYEHNSKLRANALGNFKELVKTVTVDSMMLFYLNGFLNKKGAPDENYARELQELFTIGKDTPQGYTEDDVFAAARVLTGWRVNFDDNSSYHFPLEHDFDNKQFSGFYNNTVIQGSVFGEQELDDLLDMIFARPEVAEYLCRKFYRWFVYYHIDANTEANIIKPLAQIFRQNNYEIRPVIETLLKSEHFYEAAQTGCYIKTPVDQVLGAARTFNSPIPGTTPWDHFVFQYILTYFMSAAKMMPGDPPNVAGWQAFRQTPQYYRIWINGDTLRLRNVFTDVMISYFLETDNDQYRFNLVLFIAQFSDPGDPVKMIDEACELLFPQPISAQKKFLFKSILLSGQANDAYWTQAWQDLLDNPTDPMAIEVVYVRLIAMFVYMTRLPEFQLS